MYFDSGSLVQLFNDVLQSLKYVAQASQNLKNTVNCNP